MTSAVRARPLTAASYKPFGGVIAAGVGKSVDANMGTARRYNFLAKLENRRPRARGNLCVFRCTPYRPPIKIELLERHPFSTQSFLPMAGADRYLVVVALGGGEPDLATVSAFVASGRQGISYKPGVWHHPIIALDRRTDFACLVWEDGTKGDCDVRNLPAPIAIRL